MRQSVSRFTRSGRVPLSSLCLTLVLAASASAHDPDAPEEPPPPPSPWEVAVALGGSLRGGDVSRFAANGDASVSYYWATDRLTGRVLADYGETTNQVVNVAGFLVDQKVVDTQNYGGSLLWRHDFTERFFNEARTTADSDPIQSRDVRVTADITPGYRVWMRSEKEYFDVKAGPSYRFERFNDGSPDNQFFEGRAAYQFEGRIGEALEIQHQTEILVPFSEVEAYLLRSELTLSVPLVYGFYLRTNGRIENLGRPAVGRKDTNYWITFGLEYRFGR